VGLREDAWLSRVFGYPVYALDGGVELPAGPALVYAKVPTDDVARARELGAAGFYVVDTNVTLARRPGPCGSEPRRQGVAVGVAEAGEREAVVAIAGSCFRTSRFHLDPAVARELANRVKREWIASYFEGTRGLELLVARAGGRPAGFLAVLEAEDGARVIDLVGVAPDAQGRGVGAALVAGFVRRHGERELLVGTQVANVRSLELYRRAGFGVARSAYVLHRHVEAA
jgi:ribosomal protein S18 acetylase RimI-like enzyme